MAILTRIITDIKPICILHKIQALKVRKSTPLHSPTQVASQRAKHTFRRATESPHAATHKINQTRIFTDILPINENPHDIRTYKNRFTYHKTNKNIWICVPSIRCTCVRTYMCVCVSVDIQCFYLFISKKILRWLTLRCSIRCDLNLVLNLSKQ